MSIAALILSVIAFLLVVLSILLYSIRIVPEFQRLVIFRLGRFKGVYGPGIVIVLPIIDKAIKMDLRVVSIDLASQKALTKDGVEVNVDATVYFRVLDPAKVIFTVSDYASATAMLAAAVLRDVIGMVDLDTLLAQREEIAKKIASIIDEHVSPWGIKVLTVAIKDVKLPEALIRAMAAQAEAERMRRAKVILAQADYEASQTYLKAAENYARNSISLMLRQLDTLIEIAKEKNMVVIVPSTLELVSLPAIGAAFAERRGEGNK